jgi:hypothetical protein
MLTSWQRKAAKLATQNHQDCEAKSKQGTQSNKASKQSKGRKLAS